MRKRTLLKAILLAAPLIFPPLAFAAADAPEAAQPRQEMAAVKHAGHGEHAGHNELAGTDGAANMDGASKSRTWTAFPTLKIRMGGEDRGRRVVTVVPQGLVANSIGAYSSDLKDAKGHRQLPLDMAGARLDKPAAGGFHWLYAREEQAGKVRVASTVYYFSERGGQNPTAMFMQQKHELEIIPQPYPREHSRYRANEGWKFLVRFNGKPLANQKVNLETKNGTKVELVSDAQGVINAHMPDDFKPEAEQKNADGHRPRATQLRFRAGNRICRGREKLSDRIQRSYGAGCVRPAQPRDGAGVYVVGHDRCGAVAAAAQEYQAGRRCQSIDSNQNRQ